MASQNSSATNAGSSLPKLTHLPARSYWAIVVSILAYLAYYVSNFWPSVFGVQIMEDWGINATELSLLSTVAFIGCIVFPLVASQIVVKKGEKFVAALGFILTIISVVPIPFLGNNYPLLLTTRIILGFGGGCLNMVLSVHLAHWFTKNSRGVATGLFMGALGLGMTVASLLGPLFMDMGLNWQDAAFAMCLSSAAIAGLLYLFTLPNFTKVYPGAESMDDLIAEKKSGERSTRFDKYHTASNLKEVLTSPQCWFAALFSMCTAVTVYGLGYTLPLYLQLEHGMTLAAASAMIGITFAFKIIAAPVGGFLSDRVFHGERFQVNMIDSIAGGLLILLIIVTPIDLMSIVLILAFFMVSIYGGTWATLGLEVAPKASYEAQALIGTIGSCGSFASTLICGLLIDATGTAVTALVFIAIITALGAVFAYFSRV